MKDKREPDIRPCKRCGEKFVTRNPKRECCSRICSWAWGVIKKLKIDGKHHLIKSVRVKTPQENFYKEYKDGAKKRGIRFNISQSYFNTFWNKPCYYCGDDIETIGLDRVNNVLGYIPDNIQPCCRWCNWMKNKRSSDEFVKHCTKIAIKQATPIATYNVSTDNNEAKIRED